MSFGEGGLRGRVEELEGELSRAEGTVEDLADENVELRERAGKLEALVLDMWTAWDERARRRGYKKRSVSLWMEFSDRMSELGLPEGGE